MPKSKPKRAGVGVGKATGYEFGDYWTWYIQLQSCSGNLFSKTSYRSKSAATRAMVNAARRLGIQLKENGDARVR